MACGLPLSVRLSTTICVITASKMLSTHSSEFTSFLTPVMTHIVVDKSADNAKPHSICLLPQYQRQRNCF